MCRCRLGTGLPNPDEGGVPTDLVILDEHGTVPPSEGNEVRRDGRQGVGASHSTVEAGEPDRRDPTEGRARRIIELL